jgi:CrcB protein
LFRASLTTILGLSGPVLLRRVALVAAGGAAGSVGRYVVGLYAAQRFGASFPWGTLTVNVVGSFFIGLIATLADEAGVIGPEPRLLLILGVLGGFTTFSSFSLDTLRLLEDGEVLRAGLYLAASLAGALLAAAAGIALGRGVTR